MAGSSDFNSMLSDPRRVLFQSRIVWMALLAGLAMMTGAVAALDAMQEKIPSHVPNAAGGIVFLIPWVILIGAAPMGLFIRGQVFKRHWVGDVVEPAGYLLGNILVWAMVEGAGLMGTVMVFVGGGGLISLIQPVAAWVILLLLWPNGRAMLKPEPQRGAVGPQER